jgi:leader peptidase (prepilin peptidase)/N-methyltransferase
MNFLIILIFFAFGTIIGSFLNVVIYRTNTGKSLLGRSACMSCKKRLAWYELVPIFSFIFLNGRCGHCKTRISYQYVLVEFLTGLVFALIYLKFQDLLFVSTTYFFASYMYHSMLMSLLVVILVYDVKHKIIPDNFVFAVGLFSFLGLFLFQDGYYSPHYPHYLELLRGIFAAIPFFLFWFVSGGAWMGLGDAKLMLGLGWFFGAKAILSGLVLSFWSGAIIGIGLILLKRGYGMKSELPFGPYLVLGIFISFIFGFNFFGI